MAGMHEGYGCYRVWPHGHTKTGCVPFCYRADMQSKSFRISVRADLHARVKDLIYGQADKPYRSVAQVVSKVISDWLEAGSEELPVPEDPKGLRENRIQVAFTLSGTLIAEYLLRVRERIERTPLRKDGQRIDRHEIDQLLTLWISKQGELK